MTGSDLRSPSQVALKWRRPYIQGMEILFDDDQLERLSTPGLRTYMWICRGWGLSRDEQRELIGAAPAEFDDWAARAERDEALKLPNDVLLRISHVLGIHKNVVARGLDAEGHATWVCREMPLFDGRRPLDTMLDGEPGLRRVREMLMFGFR